MAKGNVLITGGSKGIGRACVEKFVKEGYNVCFIYNKSTAAAENISENYGAFGVRADISSPYEAAYAVKNVIDKLGSIDILINNAGISLIKLFTETADEEYFDIMNTNIGGMFFVTREVVKNMLMRHCGRILNVGSMWGKVGASCEVAYSASKAAVEGFTKSLAKELGPSGICVNCIEPGVVDTDMNADLDEETRNELCNETPMGRILTSEEVADFVFAISTENSGLLTGQIIGFDGGFAI